MNVRLGGAMALVTVVVSCSSSSDTPPGGNAPGTPVTQTVGAAGGSVSVAGAVLQIPAGALPADTTISITPNAGSIPSGYTGLSQLYAFAPDGTVFQKPATITLTPSSQGSSPVVFWSNASGGYDALDTTSTSTGLSASIQHFSRGFVGERKKDEGAGADGGSDSGLPTDGGTTTPTDGGGTNGSITATVDGVAMTFSVNASVSVGPDTVAAPTIKGDDNATSTHWTLEIVTTGIAQEQCLVQGNPVVTYTHYTNGTQDLSYSTRGAQVGCIIGLTKIPHVAGDHATGTFNATVVALNLPSGLPPSHSFQSGTFDLTL
jgi:hypothetical protein